MKNAIYGTLIIVGFILLMGIAGNLDSHYRMTAEVIKVEDNLVYYEDTTGNVWLEKTDGYNVGDNVKIKFHTNYTDGTRKDDRIEKVKKF